MADSISKLVATGPRASRLPLGGEGAERAPHIHRSVKLYGPLDAEERARCAEIAEKTPVTRALKSAIAIRTTLL